MIKFHPTIDIDQYSGIIKSALLGNAEIKVYQNMGEVENWDNFENGIVYVTVVSVYVDWSETKQQTDCSTITKAIYEAFCEHSKCRDVLSLGSYIVAIFDTPFKTDIDATLDCVGKINSLFKLINRVYKFQISYGVGMHYGKVLLIKSLNGEESVYAWNGEGMETAKKHSEEAKLSSCRVRASYTIFNNLKEDYQKLFMKVSFGNYYEADPVNIAMDKWINANV
ncbi:hypothetical protein L6466_13495 [Prevotella communis]|uniref:hypothetical protein n=1 Tax=Prevotella communis TaxID=2913614 RepID=UPI001EDB7051|nr:hypothetical protein [Prevotella communis]UKK67546.1 hypothetical protein L6464_13170 [Prevotella communis]UKK70307.1 hypothetical protein L6466_13495 [Prevotella communis]